MDNLEKTMVWNSDMSSAPRDGTVILLAFGQDGITAGAWDAKAADYQWKFFEQMDRYESPQINGCRDTTAKFITHWAYLPEGPLPSCKTSPEEDRVAKLATDHSRKRKSTNAG